MYTIHNVLMMSPLLVVWLLYIIHKGLMMSLVLVLWLLYTIDKRLHDHVPLDGVLTAVHYL